MSLGQCDCITLMRLQEAFGRFNFLNNRLIFFLFGNEY